MMQERYGALRKILCKRKSTKPKDGAAETVQRCRLKPFLTHHPGGQGGMRTGGVNAVRYAKIF